MTPDRLIVRPGFALSGSLSPDGQFAIPGDKSISHRAALFAALAAGESRIENFLFSGVTQAMLNALTTLGIAWSVENGALMVHGRGFGGFKKRAPLIDCGNSATTLRLLAGALAACGTATTLDGSPGLRKRPMGRIVEPLRRMGISIQTQDGCAPLGLEGRQGGKRLTALEYILPVASAQVKSCLLLAGLAADGMTVLREPGPSRDHSERMLRAMGVEVENRSEAGPPAVYITRLVPPVGDLQPLHMKLPGDSSSAAFLVVAAVITPGSEITLRQVGLNPTRTGLLDALGQMGADIQIEAAGEQGGEPLGDLIVRSSPLHGVEISGDLVVRMIDEFPAFAVAAAYAQGETIVRDAQELRYKETDRIAALCHELRSLSVAAEETPDGFIVRGGKPLSGGQVGVYGDHRIAMALAVAGLAAQAPVEIPGAEIIHESFPQFVPILEFLGANVMS
jgi:3-phosphoshikimate 1-carboxyvinyltransferase